jgi:hypothetical protein
MRPEFKKRIAALEEALGVAGNIDFFSLSHEERLRALVDHCGMPPELMHDEGARDVWLEECLYGEVLPRLWERGGEACCGDH